MVASGLGLVSEDFYWTETRMKNCAMFGFAFYVMEEQYKAGGITQEENKNSDFICHKQKG